MVRCCCPCTGYQCASYRIASLSDERLPNAKALAFERQAGLSPLLTPVRHLRNTRSVFSFERIVDVVESKDNPFFQPR